MTPTDLQPFSLTYCLSAVGYASGLIVAGWLVISGPDFIRRRICSVRSWQATSRREQANAATWKGGR